MKNLLLPIFILLIASCTYSQDGLTAYYCPPCHGQCDKEAYTSPGICKACGMTLIKENIQDHEVKLKVDKNKKMNIAIFIHNGVELLDFAGPGEVFSHVNGFNVYTVAESTTPIISQGFVKVVPNYSFGDCPKPDIIVIPGGETSIPMRNPEVIAWIKRVAPDCDIVLSVCTGAGLLSKAGLLDDKTVTTFHNYIDELQYITPKAKVLKDKRFVDNGKVITTAGISAGIDGALRVVAKLKGMEVAKDVAFTMEYDKWVPDDGLIVSAE